jgi:uncharacterized membrane protein
LSGWLHETCASPALATLLLAGCADSSVPGGIALTRQSRESPDWGRFLPEIYGGLTACLAAHPVQPAYATDVVAQSHGMILVRLHGADASLYECSTSCGGSPTPKAITTTPQRVRGPAFTPASMPEPFMRCGSPQAVLSGTGRLLGWLTYFNTDCPPQAAAAEAGWRAFGNEPFWSLRISGTSVIFDRVGELPQSWDMHPPEMSAKRPAWSLDSDAGRLEVVIGETRCGDNMASWNYPYTAEIRFRGQLYRGCAEKTTAIP